MPVDPFSALSVAASIIQCVEFASKIVSKSKQIYKATDGLLQENEQTETVVVRLQGLVTSLEDDAGSAACGSRSPAEQRLQDVRKECCNVSTKLVTLLGQLEVPANSAHRKWKSFRQALKSVTSKKEIDLMSSKLAALRSELDTHILVHLREKVGALSLHEDERYHALNTDTQKIIDVLLETRATQSEDLRRCFETLTELKTEEHTKTRAAFIDTDMQKRRIEVDLLESLRFPMMHDRYEAVARAHQNTFEWIFKDPQIYQKPWDNFVKWLSNGTGVYWIQGKAASGKSTLMRYICNNSATEMPLRTWSPDCDPVTAIFFFWNSSIQEQRSQTGLLRSLLYMIINSHRNLIPLIFREEWERKLDLAAHQVPTTPETWSMARLQRAFKELVGFANGSMKLFFLVDGLDEYEGDPAEIAQFFVDQSRCSKHTKFCVSSRPWPVFQDIYKGMPGLKLQDLTYHDIKLYVSDKLENHERMRDLIADEPRSASLLVQELVERSSGVFLWVVLVVASLVSGLRNGDMIPHLRRRVTSLPPDLGSLYGHMLKSVDSLYREESSQIFQIFRASGHRLEIATLERALQIFDYRNVIKMQPIHGEDTREKLHNDWDRMVLRVNSRCMGLLEVLEPEKIKNYLVVSQNTGALQISYLHRTVRDYLELPRIWDVILAETEHSEFDAHTALLMSIVIEAKTHKPKFDAVTFYDDSLECLTNATNLRPRSILDAHVDLVDELDGLLSIRFNDEGYIGHWSNSNPTWFRGQRIDDLRLSWRTDCLSLAVEQDLNWYLDAKLARLAPLARSQRPGLPLLAYTFSRDTWGWHDAKKPNVQLSESILRHGADPNEECEGSTIWQYMLNYLHAVCHEGNLRREWLRVFQVMLEHGADPHACCADTGPTWSHPPNSPSNLHFIRDQQRARGELGIPYDRQYHSAETVLARLGRHVAHPEDAVAKTTNLLKEKMTSPKIYKREMDAMNSTEG